MVMKDHSLGDKLLVGEVFQEGDAFFYISSQVVSSVSSKEGSDRISHAAFR